MNDPQVIAILMEIKEDIGEIKATGLALKEGFEAHVIEDRTAHARIATLELAGARQHGFVSAWHLLATGIGAGLGYAIQFIVSWVRHK